MAAPSGTTDLSLEKDQLDELASELRARPFVFEFFQAVRVLERLSSGKRPVGHFEKPQDEAVRFGAHASLAFPASEIQEIDWSDDDQPRIAVNFMGLTGPQGVLPLYYTQLVMSRLRAGDTALRDFLDLFNRRLISLFYRAWEKYQVTIGYERGKQDRFSGYVMDLIGLGTRGLASRQLVPDELLLYYAGLLAQRPRSATGLCMLLEDYFEVPVEIEQFAGSWYHLDPVTQCALDEGDDYSQQLGSGAVVGDEIWTQESRARIRLGPLNLDQYLSFLPSGTAFESLRALTRFYCNDEIDFEAQLILQRTDVPPCELGSEGNTEPRLGWLSWMKSKPRESDAGDTILSL